MATETPKKSMNKLILISAALFISISITLHLSSLHFSTAKSNPSCLSSLHDIAFENNIWHWKSPPSIHCNFHKIGRTDASDLLSSSWIVIAGDSQARLTSISLLNLLLDDEQKASVNRNLFRKHSNYSVEIQNRGTKLDFIWSPYASNLTEIVKNYDRRRNKNAPGVVIMCAGLWHMLHVRNASEYGEDMEFLKKGVRGMRFFWVGIPELERGKLNTAEKKERMSEKVQKEYRMEVYRRWYGGGDGIVFLDLGELSRRCRCTEDGMHYHGVVYDAIVQIFLNVLLIS